MWYQSYWYFLCRNNTIMKQHRDKECWCKLSSSLSKFLQQNQFHSFFLDDSCKNHIAINDAPNLHLCLLCWLFSQSISVIFTWNVSCWQEFLQYTMISQKLMFVPFVNLHIHQLFLSFSCHFLVTFLSRFLVNFSFSLQFVSFTQQILSFNKKFSFFYTIFSCSFYNTFPTIIFHKNHFSQ